MATKKVKETTKPSIGERVKDTINPLRKVVRANMRTGTKINIINLSIVLFLVIFLNFVLPMLGVFMEVKDFAKIMEALDVSETTVGLLGEGAMVAMTSEIRKALENRPLKKK